MNMEEEDEEEMLENETSTEENVTTVATDAEDVYKALQQTKTE